MLRTDEHPSRVWRIVSARVPFPIAAAVITVSLAIVSLLAVPPRVPIDGVLYISSARSLFEPEFTTHYAWFREPGYPFFLRIVHTVSAESILLQLVQSIFLGLAVFIAVYSLRRMLARDGVPVGMLVLVVVVALDPMYLIYSGLVLQQALLTLQLALLGLAVTWAVQPPRRLPRWLLVALTLVGYALAIWTSIGWIYLGLLPVVAVIAIAYRAETVRLIRYVRPPAAKVLVGIGTGVVVVLLGIGVYNGALGVYAGWQAVKAPYEAAAHIPSSVIEPLTSTPRVPTVGEMTQRMLALMHVGEVAPYVSENELFMSYMMMPDGAIGVWDTKYDAEPYADYATSYFGLSSANPIAHDVYAATLRLKLADGVYAGSFLVSVLAFVIGLIRRRWWFAALLGVPSVFLGVYAASNSPIDRYGIPAYPWAVAAAVILIGWAIEGARRLRSRGRNAESATTAPATPSRSR